MRTTQFLFLVLITSCSGLSKKECLSVNWKQKGYVDATQGAPSRQWRKYSKACEKYDLKISRKDYISGFKLGLKDFCDFEGGYRHAMAGKKNPFTCPADQAVEFDRGFRQGEKDFKAGQEEGRIKQEYQIKPIKSRLDSSNMSEF